MSAQLKPLHERIWKKVRLTPSCWEWTGGNFSWGYGAITFDGRHTTAHRVFWTIANGPIPKGLFVLHKCDNPSCVRIDHLFLGTHTDNVRDCLRKGRYRNWQHYKPTFKCGHPKDEPHLFISGGERRCRPCTSAYWRKRNRVRAERKRTALSAVRSEA